MVGKQIDRDHEQNKKQEQQRRTGPRCSLKATIKGASE